MNDCSASSRKDSVALEVPKSPSSKISTFQNQKELPRLPIPELEDTARRFLNAVTPLISSSQLQDTKAVIHKFISDDGDGSGKHLQSLLESYDRDGTIHNNIGSYIEEFWNDAYLAPDTSVVLNLNPFFLFEDDPDPKTAHDQIRRAASLTFNSLKFAAALKNEKITPDTFKGVKLCMDQFYSLFGSCRVPKCGEKDVVEVDVLSDHVVVLFRNQFYYFRALWPRSNGKDGEIAGEIWKVALCESDIVQILNSIVEDGKQMSSKESSKSAIGVLTTLSRKAWAEMRHVLMKTSKENRSALDIIDSALFVLVLDDYSPDNLHDAAANMLHGTHVIKSEESSSIKTNGDILARKFQNQRPSSKEFQNGTCCNRWYDKLQIIVCSNGRSGINFEHSAIDGHTALRFVSDTYAQTVVSFAKSITKSIYTKGCPIPNIIDAEVLRSASVMRHNFDTNPKKLTFDLTENLKLEIFYAETALGDAINVDDTYVLEFTGYGKNFIVGNKVSPDSLVQAVMILAYYKLYGKIVCAYEPVLTKRYYHGRTEAMRSTTSKSVELCQCWTSKSTKNRDKLKALREATEYHRTLVGEASEGKGVDRHLYALKCIAERKGLPMNQFFESDAWKALNHTVLSTSNCGNPSLRLFGFGPVVSDGFGVGYIIKDNAIQYSISSKHRQTKRYAQSILETLLEVGGLFQPIDLQELGDHRDTLPQTSFCGPKRTMNSRKQSFKVPEESTGWKNKSHEGDAVDDLSLQTLNSTLSQSSFVGMTKKSFRSSSAKKIGIHLSHGHVNNR